MSLTLFDQNVINFQKCIISDKIDFDIYERTYKTYKGTRIKYNNVIRFNQHKEIMIEI